MLKTVVLTNIFVETVIHFIFQDSQMNSSKEQHLFEIEISCNIINVLTVSFDQFNVSLMNKSVPFFKKKKWPNPNFWTIVYVQFKNVKWLQNYL